jgi:predicted nucleic acid-binding protein
MSRSTTLVVDASVVARVVQATADEQAAARRLLTGRELVAPHILPAEVANTLRRNERRGAIPSGIASLAMADVEDMNIEYFSYQPCSERIWELRHNLTPYDAWYVAIAETLDAELATVDRRLVRAPGPRCRFVMPD